jgi:hypothetical protein
MQLDQAQFDALLAAIRGQTPSLTSADIIAIAAALIALAALISSYLIFRQQRRVERQSYVASLHATWWSEDLDTKRHIVWQELEKWRELGNESPAIKHHAKSSGGWGISFPERRAHARVLFFFADLNRLIAHGLIDQDIAFEMFGVAQYDWFRDYFAALRQAIIDREPNTMKRPRWVGETEEFENRLDAWKERRRFSGA